MNKPEPETPYFRELQEAHRDLARVTDPFERALANKALLQAEILGVNNEQEDVRPVEPIDIGIFRVLPTEAVVDWSSPSGEFEIKAGQIYLDFHIPRAEGISNATADEGYAQIAQYMKLHPEIIYIMGVTYRIMATSAKRNQGFNTEEITLPNEVMRYASAFWQNMMPEAKSRQFQTAHLVWHDRESFLQRFGSNE